MSIKDWVRTARAVQTHESFDGRLNTGGAMIGSPVYVQGVDGQALSIPANAGATIPVSSAAAAGYPVSVSLWFRYSASSAVAELFQWGNIPGMGARVYGANSVYPPGTVEGWVRLSSGGFALRARSEQLSPDRWHLVTLTVEGTTIWGGCRARMYINGTLVAVQSYSGGLFNLVNFDRPRTMTVGVSAGAVVVDELIIQEALLGDSEVMGLYQSAESLTRGTKRSGWGVVF
ncbi:LamG-like jellyroll fold domain-containing protein [Dorea longicatena]|uniref:LamG-like jellyroll fold domain-containing protein n=1 Tax=Bacillati TaxID=1783272 RepID=UPI003F890FCB